MFLSGESLSVYVLVDKRIKHGKLQNLRFSKYRLIVEDFDLLNFSWQHLQLNDNMNIEYFYVQVNPFEIQKRDGEKCVKNLLAKEFSLRIRLSWQEGLNTTY